MRSSVLNFGTVRLSASRTGVGQRLGAGRMSDTTRWPTLAVDSWTDTRETLHMWLQIVGKIELVSTPLINHWWNVSYEVSSRGLRTRLMHQDARGFDAEFGVSGERQCRVLGGWLDRGIVLRLRLPGPGRLRQGHRLVGSLRPEHGRVAPALPGHARQREPRSNLADLPQRDLRP